MDLYSYHIFLFPFQWQFVSKEMKNKTLEDRTCLMEFVELFKETKWKQQPYKTDKVLNYNEYNYFYSMVRDVLFDEGKKDEQRIVANLFYDIKPDENLYNFKVAGNKPGDNYESFSLHIESIILHLYSTGVGVLSFHLNNRLVEQNSPEQILKINQAGRRIYPPFFGIDFNLVGKQEQYDFIDFSFGLEKVKTKELALEFNLFDNHAFEDFHAYTNPEYFKSNPFQIPHHFKYLFQGIPFTVDKADFSGEVRKVFITPLLDDRMYVICWYGNDDLSNKLKEEAYQTPDGKLVLCYESDDWWYKFMFNDQVWATCQDKKMKIELIKQHTYNRWSEYGTFYGINRYSFVCLTSSLKKLREPGIDAAFIVNHMQTLYYKIAELCLVQRSCLLRFSEEVTGISNMADDKRINLTARVGNLYKQYLRFVNRIYFREVTAQEQGIEIYNMLQKHMQIERDVKDLELEIKELHEYVTLTQQQKQSRNIELLTIIGAMFVIPSFLTGFFGMIILPFLDKSITIPTWPKALLFLIPLVLGPIIYFILDKRKKEKWNWKLFGLLLMVISLSLGITVLYLLMFLYNS